MMIKKNIYKIICVVFLSVFVTFIFLTIYRIYKINNYDISISNEIVVTSTPLNLFTGVYSTTINGTIQNNTGNTIGSQYIYAYLRTPLSSTNSCVSVLIGSLSPNGSYVINKTFISNYDYEIVTKIEFSIDDENVRLANSTSERIIDGKVIFGIVAIFAAFGLVMVFYMNRNNFPVYNKKNEIKEQVVANEELPELPATPQNVEPEKANEEKEIAKKHFIFCAYCGAKFDSTKSKCPSCGSPIKKSLK